MIEPEVAFADLKDNMDLAEDCLKFVLKDVLERCDEDLAFLENREAQSEKSLPQDQRHDAPLRERLQAVVDAPFQHVTYTEAIELLQRSKPYKKKKFKYPVEWGVDLQSEHERWLVEKHFNGPVIITDYPAGIKAFYMRQNEDGKTVAAISLAAASGKSAWIASRRNAPNSIFPKNMFGGTWIHVVLDRPSTQDLAWVLKGW